MRIVYIGGETYPGDNGGSVHFGEVATGLVRLGHSVLAVVPYEPGRPVRETRPGFDIIRVRMKLKNRTFPIAALAAWKHVRRFKPDLIMERFVSFAGAGSCMARRWGIPLVLEVNSPHTDELIYRLNINNKLMAKLLRWWRDTQFSRATVALSTLPTLVPAAYRDRFIRVEWAANCAAFDRASIPESRRTALKKKLGMQDGPVVVFLGTFRNWHGVGHLADIMKRVIESIPDARCLAIGEGTERPAVEQAVKQAGIADSVHFTGSIPYSDVPVYISLGTVGIAPYDCDAYPPLKEFGFFWSPLKIFEYMASGMPVVTIDIEPLNAVVKNGARGYVVPEGKWDKFAEKIIKLLQNSAECSTMGAAAHTFVRRHYSWETHVKQLEDILHSVLRRNQS